MKILTVSIISIFCMQVSGFAADVALRAKSASRPINTLKLKNEIDAVRNLASDYDRIVRDLKAAGMPDTERLQWLQKARPDIKREYLEFLLIRPRLVFAMTNLWATSGNPGVIPSIPYESLTENVTMVLRCYETTDEGSGKPEEVRRWLIEDIAAIHGEYSSVATRAIQSIVKFHEEPLLSHPGMYFPEPPTDRTLTSKAFQTWYELEKLAMKWNEELKKFERSDGSGFDYPKRGRDENKGG